MITSGLYKTSERLSTPWYFKRVLPENDTYTSYECVTHVSQGRGFISEWGNPKNGGLKYHIGVPWRGFIDGPLLDYLSESYDNLG